MHFLFSAGHTFHTWTIVLVLVYSLGGCSRCKSSRSCVEWSEIQEMRVAAVNAAPPEAPPPGCLSSGMGGAASFAGATSVSDECQSELAAYEVKMGEYLSRHGAVLSWSEDQGCPDVHQIQAMSDLTTAGQQLFIGYVEAQGDTCCYDVGQYCD